MREWVSLNGCLMPAERAQISVFDSGLMQGIGLFETMRAYNGHVFRLEAHIERLRASAEILGWTVLPDPGNLAENVSQAVGAIAQEDIRVRLTVTTGTLLAGEHETPELTVIATATPGIKYPGECYSKGVTVMVPGYRQGGRRPRSQT